jgi:hypothetical protein
MTISALSDAAQCLQRAANYLSLVNVPRGSLATRDDIALARKWTSDALMKVDEVAASLSIEPAEIPIALTAKEFLAINKKAKPCD